MEISQEKAIKILHENCSLDWELSLYRDHIIVALPVAEGDFRTTYLNVKKQITKCIDEHFPDRNEELLFEIRNGSWNCGFKIKQAIG
ncbi:hypothetical protein JN11_03448 [Mucilaginibacter frigoritolerans]|jgi:hypothetical protein|uniref:Uncharacterized protein n=1 Tax=Mucilaginibacter frigoritolerans TaxID=652788 RepID=A0A562TWZ5_9SPHI|nr:hypothetical protein [Mucilaginibacter frigoritolerans]TWI97626.1 hypothetical protein JN11_03448 [Mucilaginibacter frigoritolerans]